MNCRIWNKIAVKSCRQFIVMIQKFVRQQKYLKGIKTFKIVNGKYDFNRDLFFQLDVRKYAFRNRFSDNWNPLSALCRLHYPILNYIDTFKKYLSPELKS